MGEVIRFPGPGCARPTGEKDTAWRERVKALAKEKGRSRWCGSAPAAPEPEIDQKAQAELEARRIRFGYDSWIWRPAPDDDGSAA